MPPSGTQPTATGMESEKISNHLSLGTSMLTSDSTNDAELQENRQRLPPWAQQALASTSLGGESILYRNSRTSSTQIAQMKDGAAETDSSSDELPISNRRVPHERSKGYERSPASKSSLFIPETDTATKTITPTKTPFVVPEKTKAPEKMRKKPGPQPWAKKPIAKNDMAAKLEVIREIEGHWGKGFIKVFIPKCHRPLVKCDKGKKRSTHRKHDHDPKNWMPSILKAILMIAKLTSNKAWLAKAMGEVVRYRIRNTGNRKPQLVTTDFDVIEDMLVHDWTVETSFAVRYKHLLVNKKDRVQADEDVEYILDVANDGDTSGSDNDNEVDNNGQGRTKHQPAGGYIKSPQPSQAAQDRKPSTAEGQSPHPWQSGGFGYDPRMNNYNPTGAGYPPSVPGYTGPSGFDGYDGYRGYGGFGNPFPHSPYQGFGHPMNFHPNNYPTAPPQSFPGSSPGGQFPPGRPKPRIPVPPAGYNNQSSAAPPSDASSNPTSHAGPSTPAISSPFQAPTPRIKREPSADAQTTPLAGIGSSANDMAFHEEDDVYGSDGDAALLAQMKAAEAEMKYAQLKARYEESRMRNRANKNGASVQNPLNLD